MLFFFVVLQVLRCCKAVLLWFAAIDSALQDDDDLAPLRYTYALCTTKHNVNTILATQSRVQMRYTTTVHTQLFASRYSCACA
jgi:hypothetical protein